MPSCPAFSSAAARTLWTSHPLAPARKGAPAAPISASTIDYLHSFEILLRDTNLPFYRLCEYLHSFVLKSRKLFALRPLSTRTPPLAPITAPSKHCFRIILPAATPQVLQDSVALQHAYRVSGRLDKQPSCALV